MKEALLLTRMVIEFRNAYPELIAQWERQIGSSEYFSGLHFCMTLVDGFPRLDAYLRLSEYRFDFAINAYISHSNWQSEFIGGGYDDNIVLELANREIKSTYKALNESETVTKNPKTKVSCYSKRYSCRNFRRRHGKGPTDLPLNSLNLELWTTIPWKYHF